MLFGTCRVILVNDNCGGLLMRVARNSFVYDRNMWDAGSIIDKVELNLAETQSTKLRS